MGILDRLRGWTADAARPPFERTVCACRDCVSFCKTKPGILIPSDVPAIAQRLIELKLIERQEDVGQLLRATRPSVVFDRDQGREVEIPKIGPARDVTGRCVFLDRHERCQIHGVSPFGCAYFDAHMSREESERRQLWSLQMIRSSQRYQALRETLKPAEGNRRRR
jgi:Fe-S-cluster containining protein